MRKTLVTAASFKPLEVAAIKIRPELRIADTEDDLVLADMIQSAIEAYEEFTDNILCESVWDLYYDAFPRELETPAPLISVASISYLDSAGTSLPMASSVYSVDTASKLYGRVTLKASQSWPALNGQGNAINIRCTIGYANANAIPQRIKDGLILKIQELHDGMDTRVAYENCWRSFVRTPV
jgi:uncharacterized phiE125 gp8 family phage protein